MPVNPAEPHTLHDPLLWLVELLRNEWRQGRVQRPTIRLRSEAGNVRVEDGDYVLLYIVGERENERRGVGHRRDRLRVAFDIRTYKRTVAFTLRDEVVRIIERHALRPDPHGEWDELILGAEAFPSDYADYAQIVVDATLVKHLRLRPGRRALGASE